MGLIDLADVLHHLLLTDLRAPERHSLRVPQLTIFFASWKRAQGSPGLFSELEVVQGLKEKRFLEGREAPALFVRRRLSDRTRGRGGQERGPQVFLHDELTSVWARGVVGLAVRSFRRPR